MHTTADFNNLPEHPRLDEIAKTLYFPLRNFSVSETHCLKTLLGTMIRVGVLADEVGYGKTAVILGLIDAQYESDCKPPEDNGLLLL
jgi:hypothetical protein